MEGAARFLYERFRTLNGYFPRTFREDFSGTAFNSCQFVKLHPQNRAYGIDLDEAALRWCLQNNFPNLNESERERVVLIKGNVNEVITPKVDLIAILNHSYWIFKKRSDLLRYLKKAKRSLTKAGAIVLDVLTGPQLFHGLRAEKKFGQFSCFSEWSPVDSIHHDLTIRISYRFKDGSWLRNAFVYEYRLWTLPELQDLLSEAGYTNVHVIWGTINRRNRTEDLIFRRQKHANLHGSKISYSLVVGQA